VNKFRVAVNWFRGNGSYQHMTHSWRLQCYGWPKLNTHNNRGITSNRSLSFHLYVGLPSDIPSVYETIILMYASTPLRCYMFRPSYCPPFDYLVYFSAFCRYIVSLRPICSPQSAVKDLESRPTSHIRFSRWSTFTLWSSVSWHHIAVPTRLNGGITRKVTVSS
jgi:hypothetical protein